MRTRTLAPIVLAAVLLSACGGGAGAEMARVGDSVITEGDLAALYETRSMPVGDDLRLALFRLVAREILHDAMEVEFGITLDVDAVEAEYQAQLAEFEQRGLTPAQALGVADAGLGMVRFNAELAVIRDAVVASIVSAPEYLDALFDDGLGVTTVCVSHILVETEGMALDVLERLDGGEEMGDLADELSLDGAPRGDLGCRSASVYVPDFAYAAVAADVGEPHGPVESDFGWHVLLVSDRTVLDRAAVEADPLSHVSEVDMGAAWSGWLNDQLRAADVQVVARYGTWTPTGIRAPAADQ